MTMNHDDRAQRAPPGEVQPRSGLLTAISAAIRSCVAWRAAAGAHRQVAALAYVGGAADTLVLLISSRETGRWVLPKGWPMRGLTGAQAAAREALEEAGVVGDVALKPIGSYAYRKRLHYFSSVSCEVEVYPLDVREQRLAWPEKAERRLVWLPPTRAAEQVAEPELRDLLLRFAPERPS